MLTRVDFARAMLASARRQFNDHARGLTLEEALSSAGGYRSILGVLKHLGGWTHVYRSYAFDPSPRHFAHTSWPRGLRDTIEQSPEYLAELLAWIDQGIAAWEESLAGLDDAQLDQPRPLHWREMAPLADIVVMTADHIVYHTGELNLLLSIVRGLGWEYTEEVEENHLPSDGHGVRPAWMSDAQAQRHEESLRASRTT